MIPKDLVIRARRTPDLRTVNRRASCGSATSPDPLTVPGPTFLGNGRATLRARYPRDIRRHRFRRDFLRDKGNVGCASGGAPELAIGSDLQVKVDVQRLLSAIRSALQLRLFREHRRLLAVPPTGRHAVTGGKNELSPQFRQRSVRRTDRYSHEKATTNRRRRLHRAADGPSQQGRGRCGSDPGIGGGIRHDTFLARRVSLAVAPASAPPSLSLIRIRFAVKTTS